jgi:hypothetical protein
MLPTAPALPTEESGDFGRSPFCGQLSDKPLFVCNFTIGAFGGKYKKILAQTFGELHRSAE